MASFRNEALFMTPFFRMIIVIIVLIVQEAQKAAPSLVAPHHATDPEEAHLT